MTDPAAILDAAIAGMNESFAAGTKAAKDELRARIEIIMRRQLSPQQTAAAVMECVSQWIGE